MTSGYALRRNNTCETNLEIDCGPTWGGFHACCPDATFCPPNQDTAKCWKSQNDEDIKRCANATWNLYYAENFFCCDQGSDAFRLPNGYVGCADPGLKLQDSWTVLSIVASGTVTTSTTTTTRTPPATTTSSTTTTTTTAPSTPTPTETSAHDSASKTNTGAIAGGVVGGVAGLALILVAIWLILRRRKKAQLAPQSEPFPSRPGVHQLEASEPPEVRIKPYYQGQPVHEMYGKGDARSPQELPS